MSAAAAPPATPEGPPPQGLTPAQAAAAAAPLVSRLGGAFMLDPATRAAGRARLGLRSWQLYALGRGGVLGDVPAEVVVAAFGFFPPDSIGPAWDTGRALVAPTAAGQAYADLCADWGREHLPADARLVELLERVVAAAPPAGLPLFAAWRRVPRPPDGAGRLALLLHVLREHRGSVHLAAVTAVGLDPLHAVLASPSGADVARFFGWAEPYPEVAAARARRDAAEDLTAAAAAPPYDALSAPERVELVERLRVAQATAFGEQMP